MEPYLKILLVIVLYIGTNSDGRAQTFQDGYSNLDSVLTYNSAQKDISSHRVKIFGQGGIAPTAFSMMDSLFEKKYGISYILFGCESPYDFFKMREYNIAIGKYLDKLYGKSWRKDLHLDVIGLRE